MVSRPLADALATLEPADSNNGGGGGGSSSTSSSARGGGSNSGGGDDGGAVHPERQRRVQREMMDWIKNPHEVRFGGGAVHK